MKNFNLNNHTKCIFEALFVMMKKIVLFIIFFLPIAIIAQNTNIKINWSSLTQNKTSVSKDKKQEKSNLLIDNFTLSFNKQWKDDGFAIYE